MTVTNSTQLAPLARLSETEIEAHLRGFPAATVDASKRLRTACDSDDIETFLLLLLSFFLPAGTSAAPTSANGELRLREDIGLDSLALAEAMFKIEELFDIRVENAELAEVVTLSDARRLLTGKLDPSP